MDAMSVSLSGLNAASLGMGVVANNVANVNSKDYRAKRLDFEDVAEGGVTPSGLTASGETPFPGGSNVELDNEFVNMLTYADAYKANAKALEVQQEILGTVMDMKV
jgi:flagellar basal-body rod protein FlgB